MVYAKHVKDNKIISIMTYDYTPDFSNAPEIIVITEEEYNAIYNELFPPYVPPETDPDELSDTEALAIITGEEDITDEAE